MNRVVRNNRNLVGIPSLVKKRLRPIRQDFT